MVERLGFDTNPCEVIDDVPFYMIQSYVQGIRRAQLDNIHSIFVYSDVIDYQIVGNSKALLMGVFPTTDKHGHQQSWQFNPLQYVPVSRKYIDSIRIQLCNPRGELVPFASGDSLCRLHFRRRLL